jgi:hypothetical protein
VSQSGSQQQPQQPLLVRRRAKLVLTPLALACPWQSAFVHSATHAETATLVLFAKADDLVDDPNCKARCKVCRIVAPDGHECAVSLFRHATLKLKHDYKRTKAFSKIAQSLFGGRGALPMAHLPLSTIGGSYHSPNLYNAVLKRTPLLVRPDRMWVSNMDVSIGN